LKNFQILSCSSDHTIKLWDIDLGLCLKTFNHDYIVCSLKILTDKTFASGSWKKIKIWNIDDGRCIKTFNGHACYVKDLLLIPNGSLVSCSQDKTIKLWNIEQGICTKTLNGHTLAVYCLLLLNNGHLASGSKDTTIKFWDIQSFELISTIITGKSIRSLAVLDSTIICK
jgi:WD40 repeat protein